MKAKQEYGEYGENLDFDKAYLITIQMFVHFFLKPTNNGLFFAVS